MSGGRVVTRSRAEIESALLRGEAIDRIQLVTPQQRRMFRFLLRAPDWPVTNFDPSYISDLKRVFQEDDSANEEIPDTGGSPSSHQWTLTRIESENFGGVNAYRGTPFTLEIDGESICVEGYNGHGKTSLASAIVWGLTGQRLRSQDGPDTLSSEPHPARDSGKRAAKSLTWPPVVSYPVNLAELAQDTPRATVRLTFTNELGATATLSRVINGEQMSAVWSAPVSISDQLIETSVLMPNRIPHIRIGNETRLVEVLVQLVGLEPLRQLGEHVAGLCHGSKNFAGFPKKADLDRTEARALSQLDVVIKSATNLKPPLNLLELKHSRNAKLVEGIEAHLVELTERKAAVFSAADSDIAPGIDLTQTENQSRVQQAAGRLHQKLRPESIREFRAVSFLSRLVRATTNGEVESLATAVANIREKFEVVKKLHQRQIADSRLRLKAAAAEWHNQQHPSAKSVKECPLCARLFDNDALSLLGDEIQKLKQEAAIARQTFDSNCTELLQLLERSFPSDIPSKDIPDDGNINDLFIGDFRSYLLSDADLAAVLPKARSHAISLIDASQSRIPQCPTAPTEPETKSGEDGTNTLLRLFRRAEILQDLAGWWPSAQPSYANLRDNVFGVPNEGGQFPEGTLQGALAKLLDVVEMATPLDETHKQLSTALEFAITSRDLNAEKELRTRIAECIDPLRYLPTVVEKEAGKALNEVSQKAREVFQSIYQPTSLALDEAGIGKKGVLRVDAILGENVLIDATLVANTSWVRAFLWAFVFSLRQSLLERLGHNPLPLLVLDDPQATFDHTHLRQWATLLSNMTLPTAEFSEKSQLVVTSFDPKFFDYMERLGYRGRRAAVLGISPDSGRLTILEGAEVERRWVAFESNRSPDTAQIYIARVREYMEGQLSFMLHGFGVKVRPAMIGALLGEFERRKDNPPFSSPIIQACISDLALRRPFLDLMNASHHEEERRNLGVADALTANSHWKQLKEKLDQAFSEVREYEYFGPRQPLKAAYELPTAAVPLRLADAIRPIRFDVVGRVAASTDGRVSLTRMVNEENLHFPNHAAVILNADTIYPVADIGSVLLIRQHHEPRDGDLVVAAVGDKLYARRLRFLPGNSDQIALIAHGFDPLSSLPPLVVHRSACAMKIIDGVLYNYSRTIAVPADNTSEVAEVQHDIDLTALTGGKPEVFEVSGDSASPVALNGQFLLVDTPVTSMSEIKRLDGMLTIVTAKAKHVEMEHYCKRLYWQAPFVVLQSLANDQRFPPTILSTQSGIFSGGEITSAARVNGVLFRPSKTRR